MNSPAEIEDAILQLPVEQQKEVYSRLGKRLEESGALPPPYDYSKEEIAEWLAEDARQGKAIREMFGR